MIPVLPCPWCESNGTAPDEVFCVPCVLVAREYMAMVRR